MININKVGYLYEPYEPYSKAIEQAKSAEELCAAIEPYQCIASDSYAAACKMRDSPNAEKEFEIFRSGLKKERRGKFSGDEWFGKYAKILLPEVLYSVAAIADRYCAPWGTAFNRCLETNLIAIKDGIATIDLNKILEQTYERERN